MSGSSGVSLGEDKTRRERDPLDDEERGDADRNRNELIVNELRAGEEGGEGTRGEAQEA